MEKEVRKFRSAPSPTGRIHIGHIWMFLLNYALSRKHDGKHLLRLDDTDTKRNKDESVAWLIEDLAWLGIEYDELVYQSKRLDVYNSYINELLDTGFAYKSYETVEERKIQIEEQRKSGKLPIYAGGHDKLTQEQRENFEKDGRKPIVRIKVPKDRVIKFRDGVFGDIEVNTDSFGDYAIQKSDGYPMLNFASVVDDHLLGITDVVRGFDHLNNTPKQIALFNIFGWNLPSFAHYPAMLNPDGAGKLAKRKGAKPIAYYRAQGYLPEAILNYVTLSFCTFDFTDKNDEILTRTDLLTKISLENTKNTGPRFDPEKLDWVNGMHIRKMQPDAFNLTVIEWLNNYAPSLKEFESDHDSDLVNLMLKERDRLALALPLVQSRVVKLCDIFSQLRFIFYTPDYRGVDVTPARHEESDFYKAIKKLLEIFERLTYPWDQEVWEGSVRTLAKELGWKDADLFMALRIAIAGSRFSPPLRESMNILGRDECLARINSIQNREQ